MTDDAMSGWVKAVLSTAHKPRPRARPESPEPVDMTGTRDNDRLRRMLHEALNPARPEDTWQRKFATRADLTNELFSHNENEE